MFNTTITAPIPVDIGTSILQERWHSVETYLAHLSTVERQYLSFLQDIVVCKLDIIGTEAAINDVTIQKLFAPFRPKFTTLELDQKKKNIPS